MPRTRKIKPWVLDDDVLARGCGCGKLGLICGILVDRSPMLADRDGKLPGRAAWLWRELFAFFDGVTVEDIERVLGKLDGRYIRRYEVDGEHFIQLLFFDTDQNPHKDEAKSRIPDPPQEEQANFSLFPVGFQADLSRGPGETQAGSRLDSRPIVLSNLGELRSPPPSPPQGGHDDDDETQAATWPHPDDVHEYGPPPPNSEIAEHKLWETFLVKGYGLRFDVWLQLQEVASG